MVSEDYRYGFLIGLIEGEGTVAVQKKVSNGREYLIGHIKIVNTDRNLIEKTAEFLSSFDFKFSIKSHHTIEYAKEHNLKEAWRIVISNRIDFEKLLANYHLEGSIKRERLKALVQSRIRKLYRRRVLL